MKTQMSTQKINALVVVELKKLYRDPMNLAVMLFMPVGLALIFYLALSNVYNDYYPIPGMNHFEYLLPGVMGYAVIYMGMMVALALVDFEAEAVKGKDLTFLRNGSCFVQHQPGDGRGVPELARLGRRRPTAPGAGQRRHAGCCAQRERIRGDGHRPVSHRTYVQRERSPAHRRARHR